MISLQVAGFLEHSTVNGEGFRSVLFLSGCPHKCVGCHNLQMQAFDYGDQVSIDDIAAKILKNKPLIDGVTFSGGEPFEQCKGLIPLATLLKKEGLSIWCYTGYTYEYLIQNSLTQSLLSLIDVLIDGPFILAEKDETLKYKGSSNQRILRLDKGSLIEIL